MHLRRAARSQQRVERVGRAYARVLEALDLAALGAILFKLGLAVIPELAAPLYVRNHVALTIEERAAGKRL